MNNLPKYTDDFRVIYNQAWGGHGVPDMTSAQAKAIINQLKAYNRRENCLVRLL